MQALKWLEVRSKNQESESFKWDTLDMMELCYLELYNQC